MLKFDYQNDFSSDLQKIIKELKQNWRWSEPSLVIWWGSYKACQSIYLTKIIRLLENLGLYRFLNDEKGNKYLHHGLALKKIKFPFLGVMAVCAYHIFKLNCFNNVFYM